MVLRNALDLMTYNIRKNLLFILLLAMGIFFMSFLGVIYCSQRHTYDDLNQALHGKFNQLGWVMEKTADGMSKEFKREILLQEKLYYASEFDTPYYPVPEDLHHIWTDKNTDSEEVEFLYVDPRFLRDTGICLSDGASWEDIVRVTGAVEEPEQTTVYLLGGSEYKGSGLAEEYLVDGFGESDRAVRYVILGYLKPNQRSIDGSVRNYFDSQLELSVNLDNQIIVLRYPDEYDWSYFFLEEDDSFIREISEEASAKGISYRELVIKRLSSHFAAVFEDTIAIRAFTVKSLFMLVPAFVLFVIILCIEVHYAEREHLALLIVNGFYTRTIISILLVKYILGLGIAAAIASILLVRLLPHYFVAELSKIMRVAWSEKVVPMVVLFALSVVLLQLLVSIVGLRKHDIGEMLHFSE